MPNTSKPLTAFLMTEKGHAFLKSTVERHGHLFAHVVVGEDATLDKDYRDEIIALCEAHGLPWSLRKDFKEIGSEYAMAVSWRWLIQHPQDKLIVFHDSLLPRYRGFAPLINGLINGETRFGVSAIFGASDFDTGDILFQASVDVAYPITIAELIGKITGCYVETGMRVLEALDAGQALTGRAQDNAAATHSLWRDEQDYRIDWSRSAIELARFVDALGSPYKGAACLVDGRPARILAAEAVGDVPIENRTAGKLLFVREGKPVVVCGSGLLKIWKLRYENEPGDGLPLGKYRVRFS
ncbi:MAG: hypothetical protein MO847_11870 [Candidatus Protistobacter heckmanni]|nr:hypothetical protein [Candidatus Protistobacter heckmanni]